MTNENVSYNVVCENCGCIWQPQFHSALWWKAHKRAQEGFLDAYRATGIECGCEQARHRLDAPLRVFGYTMDCQDFDVPFNSFTAAVQFFIKNRRTCEVFIEGVSESVKDRLQFSF